MSTIPAFPPPGTEPDALAERAAPDRRPVLLAALAAPWRGSPDRSQQLLTRLARDYRVVAVAPPVGGAATPALEARVLDGMTLLTPRLAAAGWRSAATPALRVPLGTWLREAGIRRAILWLATPLAGVLRGVVDAAPLVYDAAQEPVGDAAWRAAEDALLEVADLVVAAGPSLYRSLRARHARVHCIANAVEATHFAPTAPGGATAAAAAARALHAALPTPRLGFFGTLDERLDLPLLHALATRRPDWHIVLAGPVMGVDPGTLPRAPNLHWIGEQPYDVLPHLQAHWDACLLPFRPDITARHGSPPEMLAFLAGQKSVVATPAHDVVALAGHVVRLAEGPDAFAAACAEALAERGPLRRQRRMDALIAVQSGTWKRAGERVQALIAEACREHRVVAPPVGASVAARHAAS